MSTANDEGYQRRVKYYMSQAAIEVLAEDGATASHAERVTYANKILDGTASVYEFAVASVTNSTVATAIDGGQDVTDNDLSYVVKTEMYNAMAGIEG